MRKHRVPFYLATPLALILSLSFPSVQTLFTPSPGVVERLVEESRAKPDAPPPTHLDIAYRRGLLRTHRLDLYGPLVPYQEGRAPIVVFLHGGSWIQGDKVTIRVVDGFLRRMREAGYFVAAVNYTTSVLRGLQGPLENVIAAIDWLGREASRYGYDPGNMGLYGISAGGHLALLALSAFEGEERPVVKAGRQQPAVDFAFAFIECAPTDLIGMREGDAFESSGVFRLFPERRLRELSPINHVSDRLPPILIFHGGQDRTVHINQSERYVEAVRRAGGEATLVRYPEGDHAFLNLSNEMWYRQETRALEFFARHYNRMP